MITLIHESPISRFVVESLGPDFPGVDDLVHALETYCSLHCSGRALTDEYLGLLLSRMLLKTGQKAAARRVVAGSTDSHMAALDQEFCPHRVMAGLSARLIRPSRWAAAGADTTWTVDLRRLSRDPLAALELGILPALRAFMDEAAVFWDMREGKGALVLQGVDSLSVAPEEITSFFRQWLEATSRVRGWSSLPELIVVAR